MLETHWPRWSVLGSIHSGFPSTVSCISHPSCACGALGVWAALHYLVLIIIYIGSSVRQTWLQNRYSSSTLCGGEGALWANTAARQVLEGGHRCSGSQGSPSDFRCFHHPLWGALHTLTSHDITIPLIWKWFWGLLGSFPLHTVGLWSLRSPGQFPTAQSGAGVPEISWADLHCT